MSYLITNDFLKEADALLAQGKSIRHIISTTGDTPLHHALLKKNHALVEKYIEHCDANIADKLGWTALHTCVKISENLQYVPRLLALGAQASIKSENLGSTVLERFLRFNYIAYETKPYDWQIAFQALYKATDIHKLQRLRDISLISDMYGDETNPNALSYVLDYLDLSYLDYNNANYLHTAIGSDILFNPEAFEVLVHSASLDTLLQKKTNDGTALQIFLEKSLSHLAYLELAQAQKNTMERCAEIMIKHHLNTIYPTQECKDQWDNFMNDKNAFNKSAARQLKFMPKPIRAIVETNIEQHIFKLSVPQSNPEISSPKIRKI